MLAEERGKQAWGQRCPHKNILPLLKAMSEFKSLKHFSNYKVQCVSILKLKIVTNDCLFFGLFCFDLRVAFLLVKSFFLYGKIIHMESDPNLYHIYPAEIH